MDLIISAPREAVWRAIRDPAEAMRWHGWQYDGLSAEVDQIFAGAQADERAGTIDVGAAIFAVLRVDEATTRVAVSRLAEGPDEWHAIDEGWLTFVQQLRFYLEWHPGEERRTVRVHGELGDPDDAVALLDDALSELWFSSDHQQGLVVPAYGDGLAIITRTPTGGGAVVTTYGLADETFAAVRERWATFWNENFTEVAIEAG